MWGVDHTAWIEYIGYLHKGSRKEPSLAEKIFITMVEMHDTTLKLLLGDNRKSFDSY